MIAAFAHWGWAWMIVGLLLGVVARVILFMSSDDW